MAATGNILDRPLKVSGFAHLSCSWIWLIRVRCVTPTSLTSIHSSFRIRHRAQLTRDDLFHVLRGPYPPNMVKEAAVHLEFNR